VLACAADSSASGHRDCKKPDVANLSEAVKDHSRAGGFKRMPSSNPPIAFKTLHPAQNLMDGTSNPLSEARQMLHFVERGELIEKIRAQIGTGGDPYRRKVLLAFDTLRIRNKSGQLSRELCGESCALCYSI
jgi:hypothetical protein